MSKKTLIFILSSNFSGSHYLSLVLGSHSASCHLGEVKNLIKIYDNKQCALCGDLSDCSLFNGIREIDRDKLYDTLFSRAVDKDVLVDASKKVKWAKQFVDTDKYDIKVIHLVRDPRALVRRWDITYKTSSEVWRQRTRALRKGRMFSLFQNRAMLYLNKWLDQNYEISDFVKEAGLPCKVVTYYDLAADPEKVVSDIDRWIGLDYEPEQLDYWNTDHHGTSKHRYEWVKDKKERFIDLRWKEELTEKEQSQILSSDELALYLRELKLEFCSDGLTTRI